MSFSFWGKTKWFESSYNVKLKKQTIFQNSNDVALKDIKVVSVFNTETTNLFSQLLSFNSELRLIPDVYVTTKVTPYSYPVVSKGIDPLPFWILLPSFIIKE